MEQEVQGKPNMKFLILGADGYIGSYLYDRLRADQYNVTGTSRIACLDDRYIRFDILRDNVQTIVAEQIGEGKRVAIFCIAQSNIDKCYEDYRNAYIINVIKTKEVLKVLSDYNYKIIFFSSDNVFDGKEGNYSEESKTNPLNNYGKMKEEIEKYILDEIKNACIFRLPKVLDSRKTDKNLLFNLDNINKQNYKCINGNIMSFLGMEDLYKMILIAIQRNLENIFHICGEEQILRRDFIEKFFEFTNKDKRQIIECDIADMPFRDKGRPLNVGMSNKKICNIVPYKFKSIEEMILEYFRK